MNCSQKETGTRFLKTFMLITILSMFFGCIQDHKPGISTMHEDVISTPEKLPTDLKDTTFSNGRKNTFLYGNRNQEGLFAERDFFPKGYFGQPHIHDKDFLVTILRGTLNFKYGSVADTSRPAPFGPGSFMVLKANEPHYEWFNEDCIIQIEGIGPVKTSKLDSLNVKSK